MTNRFHPVLAPVLIAGALIFFAAFMPWAKATVPIIEYTAEVKGTERDGMLTLFLGIGVIASVLAYTYAGMSEWATSLLVAGCGAVTALLGFLTWIDIEGLIDVNNQEFNFIKVTVGIGVPLTTVSGAVAGLLGLACLRLLRPSRQAV